MLSIILMTDKPNAGQNSNQLIARVLTKSYILFFPFFGKYSNLGIKRNDFSIPASELTGYYFNKKGLMC
jgi:hypothetical protein